MAVPQGKLTKWGRIILKLQTKNAQGAGNTESPATDKESELEDLYDTLNSLIAENKLLEKKTLELEEEIGTLRARMDRDSQESKKQAITEFAADIICVADNIRRAIEVVPKDLLDAIPGLDNLVEGLELTERSLLSTLNHYRVTRFDPLGEAFNPHLHEAKSAVSVPDLPGNTVVRVIQAGFMIGERLLRPAGVVVAQGGPASQSLDAAPASRAQKAPGRRLSVLHKPVIAALELEGDAGERAKEPPRDIQASLPDLPLPGHGAASEATRVSLASASAPAIEDVQEAANAVNSAFEAGNYAEAARLQEGIAVAIGRAETAANGEPGERTLDALLSLSWYQLLAGRYTGVIATADQAAAINEDYISVDANRAHALMLMGSTDEARAVYNKHKGKETRNKKSWDNEILDDFRELAAANIRHPLMDEIRNAWTGEAWTW